MGELERLVEGQQIVYAGNRVAVVDSELAAAFRIGDRIVVDPDTGQILHIPADVAELADGAVGATAAAFAELGLCSDDQITAFFNGFADRLVDDSIFTEIAAANQLDVDDARARGRSVTRLVLDDTMRHAMIEGLRGWATMPGDRSAQVGSWSHDEWSLSAHSAPLGVVGFVFEGRPNVFADAAGVIRSGNTAVFRIGSDALGTARAMIEHAVRPALTGAGLPAAALTLMESRAHAAGWALFAHRDIALAVARGSGPAVAQLASVARQSGVPVSVHGTGGAWLIIDGDLAASRGHRQIVDIVSASLDRKVCNTVNTVCFTADVGSETIAAVMAGIDDAAVQRGVSARIHLTDAAREMIEPVVGARLDERVSVSRAGGSTNEPFASTIDIADLGHEWEWEDSPEVSVHLVDDVDRAVELFNQLSPHFVMSVLTDDQSVFERAYQRSNAPFFGDGMTRWVDGQYALGAPELGLSNWQNGRLLGRGGILSGDGIFTVRYRSHTPSTLRRAPRPRPVD